MSKNNKSNYNQWVKEYALADFEIPKESTKSLIDFLRKHKIFESVSDKIVLDYGAGPCSGLYQLAKNFPEVNFAGIDYNADLVSWVNDFWKTSSGSRYGLPNLSANFADWNDPKSLKKVIKNSQVHAVMSVHALCTMRNCTDAISNMVLSDPDYLIINSLFYDGPLDVLIHMRDLEGNMPDDCPDGDFNIHSIPKVEKTLNDLGYSNVIFEKFNIGVDLVRPDNGLRGTYTIRTELEERAQFSGPVYLPWYFMLASKT